MMLREKVITMIEKLIEESAKALFFRDMVDGVIDQNYYSIWEIEGEFNNENKIRNKYLRRAKEYLKSEGITL